jgi:hypothetical protein
MASHIQEYHEASSPVAVSNCKRQSTDIAAVDDLSAAKRQKMANNDLEDAEEDEEEEETGTKYLLFDSANDFKGFFFMAF